MPIGAKILDAIDEAIRLRDKVLLILSEGAIARSWVEREVTRALADERERQRTLLFPTLARSFFPCYQLDLTLERRPPAVMLSFKTRSVRSPKAVMTVSA